MSLVGDPKTLIGEWGLNWFRKLEAVRGGVGHALWEDCKLMATGMAGNMCKMHKLICT